MMKEKTSIIVMSHNYGRFLKQSIQSVLNQSVFPKEILVINDASEDETEDVAKSFGEKIKYFKVDFRNAQKTRNFGLEKSTGEYILYLDADDYLQYDCLELMEREMKKDCGVDLVYSGRFHRGRKGLLRSIGVANYWEPQDFCYKDLMKNNYISITSLIRKEKFCGFDEDIERFQDWEAWLSFLKNGKAVKIAKGLFTVRFHGKNRTFTVAGEIERVKILVKHGFLDILAEDYKEKNTLLSQKDQEIQTLSQILFEKNQQVALMESSRFWKLRGYYMKLRARVVR